jgi:hypothetical protein
MGKNEGAKPLSGRGKYKRGVEEVILKGSLRGATPLFRENLPLPLIKGKGIKGIGLPQ